MCSHEELYARVRYGLDKLQKGEWILVCTRELEGGQKCRSCRRRNFSLDLERNLFKVDQEEVEGWNSQLMIGGVQSQKHGIFGFMKSFSEGEPGSPLRIMKYMYTKTHVIFAYICDVQLCLSLKFKHKNGM